MPIHPEEHTRHVQILRQIRNVDVTTPIHPEEHTGHVRILRQIRNVDATWQYILKNIRDMCEYYDK
jgi:hypothetical protein